MFPLPILLSAKHLWGKECEIPLWYGRSKSVVATMRGLVLCFAMLPANGYAAVTEDEFLVRTTGDLVELCNGLLALRAGDRCHNVRTDGLVGEVWCFHC